MDILNSLLFILFSFQLVSGQDRDKTLADLTESYCHPGSGEKTATAFSSYIRTLEQCLKVSVRLKIYAWSFDTSYEFIARHKYFSNRWTKKTLKSVRNLSSLALPLRKSRKIQESPFTSLDLLDCSSLNTETVPIVKRMLKISLIR